MTKQAVIFDGDDTLWLTQPIYKAVIEEFYSVLKEQGFKTDDSREMFSLINLGLFEAIKLSTQRLELAMSLTYKIMCARAKEVAKASIIQAAKELAGQIYTRAPQPMENVHEVLSSLSQNFELFFYSGGKDETQRFRLKSLGLDQYFQNRVFIFAQKDKETLNAILGAYSLDPVHTWIIGNSPNFEINPGILAGLNCIWMHTSFWTEDLKDINKGKAFIAFSLQEAANILLHGRGLGQNPYIPSEINTREIQAAISEFSETDEIWIIGNSPKLDINPASCFSTNLIWIPEAFNSDDIEPFNYPVFVAFSSKGAEEIITRWGKSPRPRVIQRLKNQQGDLGGSLVVE